MMLLASFSLCMFLPTLALAQTPPGCSYNGKSYSFYDQIIHANGCATLKCQNGVAVVVNEACGKDVDKSCHLLKEQFIYKNTIYVCTKTSSEYKNQVVPLPLGADCTAEGKTYKDREHFVLSNVCEPRQCQNGVVVDPFPFGAQSDVNGTLYQCMKVLENGAIKYRRGAVLPPSKNCVFGGITYQDQEIFVESDGRKRSQCQNGKVVVIQLLPICDKPGKDVILILDESGGAATLNFERQKTFWSQVVQRFRIGTDASKSEFLFSAIKFGTIVTEAFQLKSYPTLNSLLVGIRNLAYGGGGTRTERALDYIKDNNLFDSAAGGRANANNIAALFLDGISNHQDLAIESATRLKSTGVKIVCMGVELADVKELSKIASDPNSIAFIDNYNNLAPAVDIIAQRICDG